MKRSIAILLTLLFSLFALNPAVAEEANVQELQQKLDALMRQMQEMDSTMKAQKAQIEALQNKIKELQMQEVPQVSATTKTSEEVKVTSKYKVNFYGQLKFDAIYDTNNMGRDEFITYIPRTADGEDKTTFNVRDTRLGIAIEGPEFKGWIPKGRFETDFYGGGVPDSNGALRIRLAYIDFAKGNTLIRIGQDWNKIASLNPTNADFAIMGYNGNLWNRVPQITVQQKFNNGVEGLLTVYRYRWADDDENFGGTNVDTQIHLPWIGGRIGYSGILLDCEKKAWIAVSGAIRNGEANDNNVTPYVAAIEWNLPYKIFELSGEGYMGQGLGSEYFHKGGSFNAEGKAILTRGGFLQLNAKPFKNIQFTAGYGIDDPKNSSVDIAFYQQSEYLFGNVYFHIMKDITAALQVAYLETVWSTGKNYGTRYTTALTYNW